MNTPTLEANRSALLVMDFQADIIGMIGDRAGPLLERTARVIAAARKARLPIIYVVVAFRPGYPELSPRGPAYAMIASSGRMVMGTPGAEVVAALRPEPDDVVVTKRRTSAFGTTDLEAVLRAKGIDTLILCGIATGGVVTSTVRHAADADYRMVVVKDCCADADDEVHRVLTEKLFVRQAAVITGEEAIAALAGIAA